MATSNHMPKDVEARIRALPGNGTCADCNNINPQWASVTYGTLVCLECSGQHRSLGVHLSFVRSVQMDSWTEKQIAAMEMSGGNAKLVEYMSSRKIPKTMSIASKYNTKQAEYYRSRLSRWLEGNKEPPPDPGNYDPVSGGDALGAEPLPGETTEEYNARQARLREAARERLRQKFGDGGMMGGMGSTAQAQQGNDLDFGSVGGAVRAVGGVVGGAVGGLGSFLKNNVLESETAQNAWRSVQDSDVIGALKRNTIDEGSGLRRGMTDLWEKVTDNPYDAGPGMNGNQGGSTTRSVPGKSGPSFDDDFEDFGHDNTRKPVDAIPHAQSAPAIPSNGFRAPVSAPTPASMRLGGDSSTRAAAAKPAAAAVAAPPDTKSPSPSPPRAVAGSPASSPGSSSPGLGGGSPGSQKKDKERAKLQSPEDFFAEFGV